jgi:hypothetical protein
VREPLLVLEAWNRTPQAMGAGRRSSLDPAVV